MSSARFRGEKVLVAWEVCPQGLTRKHAIHCSHANLVQAFELLERINCLAAAGSCAFLRCSTHCYRRCLLSHREHVL